MCIFTNSSAGLCPVQILWKVDTKMRWKCNGFCFSEKSTCVRGSGEEAGESWRNHQRTMPVWPPREVREDWVEVSQSAMQGKEALARLMGGQTKSLAEGSVSFRIRPARASHRLQRSSLWEAWCWPRCGDGFQSAEAEVSGQWSSPWPGVCEAHSPGCHVTLQFSDNGVRKVEMGCSGRYVWDSRQGFLLLFFFQRCTKYLYL